MWIVINVNHYMNVCHGEVIQSSYYQHIHVDAALFQFEVIPLLISAETLVFVLGIKLQLNRIQLLNTHRSFYGEFTWWDLASTANYKFHIILLLYDVKFFVGVETLWEDCTESGFWHNLVYTCYATHWLKLKAHWLWVEDYLVEPGTSKVSWSLLKYNEWNSAVTAASSNIGTQTNKQKTRMSLKKSQNVIMGKFGKSSSERQQTLCKLSQNQR